MSSSQRATQLPSTLETLESRSVSSQVAIEHLGQEPRSNPALSLVLGENHPSIPSPIAPIGLYSSQSTASVEGETVTRDAIIEQDNDDDNANSDNDEDEP
jgi:hypothetical protein